MPSKTDALGISFDSVQQANFRFIVAAVVIYFLFVFTYQMARLGFYDGLYKATNWKMALTRERLASSADHSYSGRIEFWRGLSISLGPVVETIIPYIVGLLGIGSVFKMLPDSFYLGIL